MKISLNWINEYIENPKKLDPHQLASLFTARTAEVEGVHDQAEKFGKMVVGQIKTIEPHPNADKLRITKTDVGSETLQIVCGASNIYEGQYVPVALIGAKVRWHGEGDLVTLEPATIRGIESKGMICAAEEIGLSEEKSAGIMDLGAFKPQVGMPLAEALGQHDTIMTVDNKSLTHRPDLWGHYGIAREIAAITNQKLRPFQTNVSYPHSPETADGATTTSANHGPSAETATAGLLNTETPHIRIKEKKLCPRYTAVILENITIEPSPLWLQQRLAAIGYRSINNIVDATNYVMAELGQPLHAFDATKIHGGIVVRTAEAEEKIRTLDGVERSLFEDTLIIADHKKPLAIAGIMGGADSEITPTTTKILLESANFNPASVRKSSVRLGLRTEAVQRFEKSLDPMLTEQALDRVCTLILQLCPSARIAGPKADIQNLKMKKTVVTVDLKKVFAKIGATIPTAEVVQILERLEFKPKLSGKTKLKVEVPSFRATKDIAIEDDLVEEIARMHGYENIVAQLPELPIKLPLENKERQLKHRARQALATGLSFNEVYNYSFYSLADIKKSLLPEELHLTLQNYLSEDQTHLRVSLMPNLLKNIAHNLKFFDQFKLFEIGRTYEDLQEYFPIEAKKISGVIVRSKKNNAKDDIFYEAKGALEAFFSLMKTHTNLLEMRRGEALCPYAHPNKYAGYYLRGGGTQPSEEIARVFELHPLVAKNYELNGVDIGVFEINFTRLAHMPTKETKYKPLPRFPGIEIDISVVIDDRSEIGTIQKMIKDSDRELIQSVRLFDLYQGPNIPAGKKALAFKVLLQSPERTLTDEEMKKVQQKIFEKLLALGGEIRGLTK